MKHILEKFTLLSLVSFAVSAQEPVAPNEQLLSKINPLLNSQAITIDYFKAPADKIAIGVVTKGFDKRIYYTSNEGSYLMSGMMFDVENKQSVNDLIMPQINIPLSPEATDSLTELDTITVGDGEDDIYAFVDLNCPFCHRFFNDISARLASGQLNATVHYIIVNQQVPSYKDTAAQILAQSSEKRLRQLSLGMQKLPLSLSEVEGTIGHEKLQKNQAAFRKFSMAGGVPFVVGKYGDKWDISKGVPRPIFYANFTSDPNVPAVGAP